MEARILAFENSGSSHALAVRVRRWCATRYNCAGGHGIVARAASSRSSCHTPTPVNGRLALSTCRREASLLIRRVLNWPVPFGH
jgi:hypothetical protein